MKNVILISLFLVSLTLSLKAQLTTPVSITGAPYAWEHQVSTGDGSYYLYDVSRSIHRLVLDGTTGNVGIGTTTAGSRLTIYGNDGANTPTFSIFTKQVGTGSFQKIALIDPTGSDSNDGYFQLLDNGTVKVNIAANNARGGDTYFNSGGNVGIGTTEPNVKTQIRLSSAQTSLSEAVYLGIGRDEYAVNSYRLIGLGYKNTGIYYPSYIGYQEKEVGGYTYGDLVFFTRNTIGDDIPSERMRINSDGTVTINSHIYSKQRIDISDYGSNDDLYVRFNDKAALTHFNTQAGDNNLYINVDWTQSQGFHHDFSSGVVIGGNVSIGTNTTPQHALDVNGSIRAKEVTVTLEGWSDFVFKPTYNLKPLTEVEQYIKTNGHLEAIPSAQEVEQNGVSLGDMQAKLLQKVEELTLYVIEQQKQINTLKEQNTTLVKELQALKK